jgi:hypothetical protein
MVTRGTPRLDVDVDVEVEVDVEGIGRGIVIGLLFDVRKVTDFDVNVVTIGSGNEYHASFL